MAIMGRMRSSSMHTPATTMRAARGASFISRSIRPGTPTHSKITAGRSFATSRKASMAGVSAGSFTTWAPMVSASRRRRGE
jgi:hypothetical protein